MSGSAERPDRTGPTAEPAPAAARKRAGRQAAPPKPRPRRSRSPAAAAPRGSRRTRSDEIYARIKAKILDGEFSPGAQFFEQDLADSLAVSRTPVREAMVRLADDGLVEVQPRRGMRILPISLEAMREIYELLACLEAMAASLLAARRLPPDAAAFRELETAQLDMESALVKDDIQAWADADARFHRALLEHCGNERLARMAFTVWDQSHRARMISLPLRPKPVQSTQEHRALVEAVRRHDAEAAHAIHRAHRLRGMQTMLDVIQRYRLRQL